MNTDKMRLPTQVVDIPGITLRNDEKYDDYGKWMVYKDLEDLDDAWKRIGEAILADKLPGCRDAKCSTLYYDPTRVGPGPCTTGAILVYTKKDDIDAVGFELIKLVQQDIKYKSNEKSKEYQYAFTGQGQVTDKTLYWNSGTPSFKSAGVRCYGHTRDKEDKWQVNIVNAREPLRSEEADGKWILTLEYEELTPLWHSLKAKIESGEFKAIKMECPPKLDYRSRDEKPRFFIFTSTKEKSSVGRYLIEIVKRAIHYEFNSKPHSRETLYWNEGKPDYKEIRR